MNASTLYVARNDERKANAPAVSRKLRDEFKIITSPDGWRVRRSLDEVAISCPLSYPDGVVHRRLTTLAERINRDWNYYTARLDTKADES